MVFQSLARFFGEFFDRSRKGRRRKPQAAKERRLGRRPLMEVLEDRLAPATLSAPIVQNSYAFLDPTSNTTNGRYAPQIAVDPLNPNNMAVVTRTVNGSATPHSILSVNYSNDGGAAWSSFSIGTAFTDPQTLAPYEIHDDPSVTFDRLGYVYIVAHEHDANQESGVITISKYDFDDGLGNFFTPVFVQNAVHQWYAGPANTTGAFQDSAYHPVVGIDNNLPSYTDPQTGLVQTDSLATLVPDPNDPTQLVPKAVFVAWTSREVSTSSPIPDPQRLFNGPIGVIKLVASGDGGVTFSTRETITDNLNQSVNFNAGRPQFFFTQGTPYDPTNPLATPRIQGGQMGIVYDNYSGQLPAVDLSLPDQGNAQQMATVTQSFAGTGGVLLDAFQPEPQPGNANPPHLPQTTTFVQPVAITDPNFDYLTDFELTLNIIHANTSQLQITLTAPNGTTITLVRNRLNADGTTNVGPLGNLVGLAGANIGTVNGVSVGTVFNQSAKRRIRNQIGTFEPVAPYTGYFQPEAGTLAVFNGLTAAELTGNWILRITDFRADGVNPGPTQTLSDWNLKFTARFADNGKGNVPSSFGVDTPMNPVFANFGETVANSSFTSPYPLNGGVYGTQGIGPGVVVAADNTLGSFSPYQGRIYVALTSNLGNVYVLSSDDGQTFLPAHAGTLNDDSTADNFSEGNRVQFIPSIAVDQVTGTLVVSWYDGRNDASRVRVANYITTSIDGGETYSEQVPINVMATAKNALTGETIKIEPIPGNQALAGTYGFGYRQALYAYNGRVMPLFSSNLNSGGVGVYTADIYIGAGPRVLVGDQGPVVADFTAGTGLFYNNTFGPDGKRRLDGFVINFDRPIDPGTLSPSDIALMYQDPRSTSANLVNISNQILSVTPLDSSASHGVNDAGTLPTLVLNDAIVTEGNSGQKFATLTVTMSQVLTTPTTVSYTTADGSAQAGSDYLPQSGRLTIPAGSTSATFTVPIVGDTFKEGNEFFWVGLFNVPVNVTATKPLGRVTLLDDEDSPTLVIGDGYLKEGDAGLSQMVFPIVLSAPSAVPITVTYATSDGTATAGTDYNAVTGAITIPAGITNASIAIPVTGDQVREGNENFFLNLVGRFNRSEQQTLVLGNSGNPNANVTLGFLGETATSPLFLGTTPTAAQVQANLSTISALAGNITVTSPVAGTYVVTFTSGAGGGALAGLDVPLINLVSAATGGTATITETQKGGNTDSIAITRPFAVGVIVDDDDLAVSVADVTVREGTDANAVVTFHLNGVTANPVTVNFNLNTTGLLGPTATNFADYNYGGPFSVVIPAGSLSASVNIPIVDDLVVESIERFNVSITSVTNAASVKGTGIVTIVDDDTPAAAIFVVDSVVREGDSGTANLAVTIRLSEAIDTDVNGSFSTTFTGTATGGVAVNPGVDFLRVTNQAFTITAGSLTTTVLIPIVGDVVVENDETIGVQVTNVTAGVNSIDTTAAGAKTTGTVTIVDDDVHIYLADAFEFERFGNMGFVAYLDSPKDVPITFRVNTQAGTATDTSANAPPAAGEIDYVTVFNQLITIPAGATQVFIPVTILNDAVAEYSTNNANEFFNLVIDQTTLTVGGVATNAASGIVTRGFATGTIVDDDAGVNLTVSNPTVLEGNAGATFLQYTLYLSQVQAADITVHYQTQNGTAIASVAAQVGDDYVYNEGGKAPPATNLFRIPAGFTQVSVFVQVNGDVDIENNENFRIAFSNPSAGNFTQNVSTGNYGFGTGTILNDDRFRTVFASGLAREGETMTFNGITNYGGNSFASVGATFDSGTATAGVDYTPATDNQLFFGNSVNLSTDAVTDNLAEGIEQFTATITGGTIAVSTPSVIGRIIDADRLTVFAGDTTVQEVNGGTTTLLIPVYLSGTPNAGQTVTVDYSLLGGSAFAGVDYVDTTGTLVFDPTAALPIDRVRQFISVTINSDNLALGNKTFFVNFSNLVNAGRALRTETQLLSLTNVNNITFSFGGQEASAANNFGLTAANIQTALATIIPGVTVTALPNVGTTQNFSINFNNSSDVADIGIVRAYFLNFGVASPGVATITETQKGGSWNSTVTILDASQRPNLTMSAALVAEGNTGSTTPANFTVIASYPLPVGTNITAQISTANGTATAGTDYVAVANQTVTIVGGTTSTTFTAQVNGDAIAEGEETFTATIGSSTNSYIRVGTGTAVIVDNDGAPNISIGDVSIQEGNYNEPGKPKYATVTAYLNKAVGYDVTFTLSTANNTALGNVDYVPSSLPNIRIPAGSLTATFQVEILADTIKEGDESFFVNISNVAGASTYKGQSTVTIQDDDGVYGATQFLVRIAPQDKVGAYSYSVGPNVGDRVRTAIPTADAFENGSTGVYTPNLTNQNLPIGGPNATQSQIILSGLDGNQVLRDLTVTVNINHPDPSNFLTIDLIAPDGRVVALFDSLEFFPLNVSGGNLTRTTFDQRSDVRLRDARAPFVGSVQPMLNANAPIQRFDALGNPVIAVPLSLLNGMSPNGTWTLRVQDSSGQFNAGTLLNWSLNVDTGAALAGGQLGNAMDQDQSGLAADGNRGGDAFAIPEPQNGRPFQLPYVDSTSPLVIPGPHSFEGTNTYVSQESVRIPSALYGGTGTASDKSTSTIAINNVDTNYLISDVNVTIAFQHTNSSNLTFTLVSPAGTRVILAQNSFLSSPTTFDDQTGGFSPATYRVPAQALSIFNGFNPNGVWTLEIQDSVFPSSGTLLQWSLEIGVERVAVNSTISAYQVDFDRDINVASFKPANILRMVGPAGEILGTVGQPFTVTPINPTPGTVVVNGVTGVGTLARSFVINFPTQFLNGTYSFVFGPDPGNLDPNTNYILDSLGNAVDTNLNAGVSVLRGADPTNFELSVVDAVSSNLVPGNILGSQTTAFPITVNDAFLINYLTLTLDIDVNDVSLLDAQLISPTGTIVQLFSAPGRFAVNSRQDMQNTTLDDAANTPINLGNPPFTSGRYNPQTPLSALIGETSKGTWLLSITNRGAAVGTLTNWALHFTRSLPGTGLGERGSDQFQQHFRVFVQDPTSPLSKDTWTPVGGTSQNLVAQAGNAPIPAVAIDAADPSGNTAYVGTSSGGVWKTSNFLTADPLGPSYVPLLDFAPISAVSGHGLNIASIAVFARNRDPNQSIVFVGTGGAGGNGIGLLRSLDGGKTWQVLDSRVNTDGAGNVLALNDPARDLRFVSNGVTNIVVDPALGPGNQVILYITVRGGPNPGLYRSTDTGNSWTLVRAGVATDVILAPGSKGSTGNLSVLYAGFANEGVFFTDSATTTLNLTRLDGNQGVNYRVDGFNIPIPVNAPIDTPTTNAGGNIRLATPAITGNPLLDAVYQGYIYAVSNNVLYVSKDFGSNWTHVKIPVRRSPIGTYLYGTNDEVYVNPALPNTPGVGDFPNVSSIAVDPQNPNVIFLQWTGTSAFGNPTNIIRVDITTLSDPYALVEGDHSENDGGRTFDRTQGPAVAPPPPGLTPGTTDPYGIFDPDNPLDPKRPYYDALRDPDEPFIKPTGQLLVNVLYFENDGSNVKWTDYWSSINSTVTNPGSSTIGFGGLPFIPTMVTTIDPATGLTRVVLAGVEGLFTALDDGTGQRFLGEGKSIAPTVGNRTGNIAAGLYYDGAAQPSILAANLARSLFTATSVFGTFSSSNSFLSTGNLAWYQFDGSGRSGQTDPSGSGITYEYVFPGQAAAVNPNLLPVDFFHRIQPNTLPTSATVGLLQAGDVPSTGAGQWPGGTEVFRYDTPTNLANETGKFAINPVDPTALVIGSSTGRVYRTQGTALGQGKQWQPIAAPTDLDGTYAGALAFGSPSSETSTTRSDFIYAGTTGGRVYVAATGGGTGGWRNISTGLDGTAVLAIVPNPKFGAKDVFAVTTVGVFYMPDSSIAAPAWIRLNDVAGRDALFAKTRTVFGTAETTRAATFLTDVAVDWRYAIPGGPTGTHPVLYVSTDGGVFRSTDLGVTWNLYPQATPGTSPEGGYLPNVVVSDIDLVLGNTTPGSGFVNESTGFNLIYATTFGRGAFAMRLDNSDVEQFRTVPTFGPKVTSVTPYVPNPQTTLQGLDVVFDATIDPVTFTAADVTTLVGPGGAIAVTGIQVINETTFRILFTPQPLSGNYTVTLGPTIADYSGNLMNQNNNLVNGEATDNFSTTLSFVANTAPTISPIADIARPLGQGGATVVNFTIDDAPAPVSALVVSVSSSNQLFVPNANVVLGGTGANRTLTITPVGASFGVTTITITVTDAPGLTSTLSFKFAIDTAPVLLPIGDRILVASTATNPQSFTVSLNPLASDVDGQTLTFLAPTTVGVQTPAFVLDRTIGLRPDLFADGTPNYYPGLYGVPGSKWLVNAVGSYFVITAEGNLHLYSGNQSAPLGDLVAALDPSYNADPTKCFGLISLTSYSQNRYGQNEKWLFNPGGYGSNDWYAILPNGELHQYGGPAAPIGPLVATFTTGVNPSPYHTDPTLITDPTGPNNPAAGTATITNGILTVAPPFNFTGSFAVTVTVFDGFLTASQTFNVTVTNKGPSLGPIPDLIVNHSAAGNPSTVSVPLTASDPDGQTLSYSAVTSPIATPAYVLDQTIGLRPDVFANGSPNFYVGLYGLQGSKWLKNADGFYFVITASGALHVYSGNQADPLGFKVMQLDASYNADPTKLYGLMNPYATYTTNLHGAGEKWLFCPGNLQWYAILPDGTLRQYVGGAAVFGPVLGQFPLEYFNNPELLTEPPAPNAPPASSITFTGNTLNVTPPANFIGSFLVTVSASDGVASVTRSLVVTVHDRAPKFAIVPEQILDHSAGPKVIALNPSDPDAIDTVTFSVQTAAATSTGFQLDRLYGFFKDDPTYSLNLHGLNEKWIYGAFAQQWFALVPNTGDPSTVNLYRYVDDGGIAAMLANGPVPDGMGLPVAYYNNPQLLHDPYLPINPPAGTVSVSGSNLTITPPANYAGTFEVTVTGTDGMKPLVRKFFVTITNNAPTLNPIANVTVGRNATAQVNVAGADPDGDNVSYSLLAPTVAQFAYDLDLSGNLGRDGETYYGNLNGLNEKYVYNQNNGVFYFILPNGEFRQLNTAENPIGQLLGTFPQSFYANPELLIEASTPISPNAAPVGPAPTTGANIPTLSLVGNTLTINPNGYFGQFQVTVLVSDGVNVGFRKFLVTTT